MTNITIQERKDIKDKNKRFRYSFFYNGKRYRGSGYRTKGIAREKARQHLEQLENEVNTPEIVFKELYLKWIDDNNKKELSKGQYYWYTYSLELFIEYFGEDKKVKDINKESYQKFLNWYGKGRTQSSLEKVHVCISQVLRYAHSEGILLKDPTFQARTRVRNAKKAITDDDKFLTINQYLDLIEYFRSKNERSYLVLFILAITGGRFSEVNKLTLDDFHDDAIHLRGTKTESSDRIVGISDRDMKHILNTIDKLPKKTDGSLLNISHRATLKAFQYSLDHLGIKEHRTPYSLRHTHCSFLISKSIPIEVISKRLGHKNVRITQEVYSHVLKEYEDEHTKKIRSLFS